jgi:hypothetical protein
MAERAEGCVVEALRGLEIVGTEHDVAEQELVSPSWPAAAPRRLQHDRRIVTACAAAVPEGFDSVEMAHCDRGMWRRARLRPRPGASAHGIDIVVRFQSVGLTTGQRGSRMRID